MTGPETTNKLETKENQELSPEEQKWVDDIIEKYKSDPDFVANATKDNPSLNAAQELLAEKVYQENKLRIIDNITTRKLNTDYNTIDPNNIEYKNKLFLKEKPTQIKAYLAYYNLQKVKTNTFNKTNIPLIDIDTFMANFEKEQKKNNPLPDENEEPAAPPVNTDKVEQDVGKFIELGVDKKNAILT